MSKDEQFNFRMDSDLKRDLKEYADTHGYSDMTKLIEDAIKEKIYTEKMQEEEETRMLNALKKPHMREAFRRLLLQQE